MQQLAEAAMEREAYAEEVCLYCPAWVCFALLCLVWGPLLALCASQARQAGAVSKLTKVLASTGAVVLRSSKLL